jgi:D-glycero-alpha-D-manno-heptose-7-phosphate kinase
MKKISVKSPTRVDLAGGTLDLWPLYNFVEGAITVNVAIDIWTQVDIEPLDTAEIELVSQDLSLNKKFKDLNHALSEPSAALSLLQSQLKFWQPQKGFRLTTQSQSPIGGGLGGSSSLIISMLKAFSQFCERPFASIQEMVHVAHNIEAQVLNTPTGTQDYFPAASGGINLIEYDARGIKQEVLTKNLSTLSDHFLLVYTGKAHHSGINNFTVLEGAVRKDPKTLQALQDIKKIALETALAVRRADWNLLPGLFRQEYDARIRLSSAFTSPEIEKLSELSLRAGAQAVKICGAGGGGCVLLWAPPECQAEVKDACRKAGFQVLAAKPVASLQ